jgi:hypothetical protein
MDDAHLGIRPCELVGDLARAVRAAVVDDEDLEVGRERGRRAVRGDDQAGDWCGSLAMAGGSR